MKLNKIMLAVAITCGMSTAVYAANQGHGKVTFTGAIIDAPCSIKTDSSEQTVEMGDISKVALKNGGQSPSRTFAINLENCIFEGDDAKNKVTLTFTGAESSNGRLGITGTAKGASIVIADAATSEQIVLGKPTKPQTLQDGNNSLNFTAYLQGHGASATVTEGEFQAVTDFTLAYN